MWIIVEILVWLVPHFDKKTVVVLEEADDYIDFEVVTKHNPQKGPYATVDGFFWMGFVWPFEIYDFRNVL